MASSPKSRTKKSAPKGASNTPRNDSQTKRFLSRETRISPKYSVEFELTTIGGAVVGLEVFWSPHVPPRAELAALVGTREYAAAAAKAMAEFRAAGLIGPAIVITPGVTP